MQKIAFTISLPGVIKIDGDQVTITIDKSSTRVTLEPSPKSDARLFLGKGKTIFDVILDTARQLTRLEGPLREFSAAELFHIACRKYPNLKRNSWTSHVIASAPGHPSYRHYGVRKDYFVYGGEGIYRINPECLEIDSAGSMKKA